MNCGVFVKEECDAHESGGSVNEELEIAVTAGAHRVDGTCRIRGDSVQRQL